MVVGSTCYMLTMRAVMKDKSISRFVTSLFFLPNGFAALYHTIVLRHLDRSNAITLQTPVELASAVIP